MYLYLSSSDSTHLYPDNTGVDFTVRLPQPITGQNHMLGMVHCITPSKPVEPLYIVCDVVQSSVLGEYQLPILDQTSVKTKEFTHVAYKPVTVSEISTLRVKLLNRRRELASYTSGKTYIILHLKQWETLISG